MRTSQITNVQKQILKRFSVTYLLCSCAKQLYVHEAEQWELQRAVVSGSLWKTVGQIF